MRLRLLKKVCRSESMLDDKIKQIGEDMVNCLSNCSGVENKKK